MLLKKDTSSDNGAIDAGIKEYYTSNKEKDAEFDIHEENNEFLIEWVQIMNKKNSETTEAKTKYPIIQKFLKEFRCNHARIDHDINLNNTGGMVYEEQEHSGTRYFLVDERGKDTFEIPGEQGGNYDYIPFHEYKPETIIECINRMGGLNRRKGYIITFHDNSDPNEKSLVITKVSEIPKRGNNYRLVATRD